MNAKTQSSPESVRLTRPEGDWDQDLCGPDGAVRGSGQEGKGVLSASPIYLRREDSSPSTSEPRRVVHSVSDKDDKRVEDGTRGRGLDRGFLDRPSSSHMGRLYVS